ncbi:MAG: phenylalanine--tRNA ligase subunit beta [Deltaproteobacteria bacterium]|nr:phenylalanine--tRNA ligase subunit beta [Deltaproteobacteria bacterium]
MLVSYKWLCKLAGFNPTVQDITKKLTFSGLEVADIRHRGPEFNNIIVAQITDKKSHPTRDKLSLVEVDTGNGEIVKVVCGAPNCPLPGAKVVLAKVGAMFGDFVIEPRTLADAESFGMLCSEKELDIGPEDDGIIILETESPAGTPIIDALDLEDWIIELEVTPNRPDALYHIGIAREICVLFDKPFNYPKPAEIPLLSEAVDSLIDIKIEDPEKVLRYSASIIKDVKISPSPFNIRYLLHNIGIRPISNIVDITNYILMGYGQPLHAFDLNKIKDSKIITRNALPGEKMKTLDNIDRSFSAEDILICDGEKAIAVAGVMGGLDTEVTDDTTDILIECANFNPSAIRKTSKKLKLSSDSSYRFERGIDPNHMDRVLKATASMITSLGGGKMASGFADIYPVPVKPIEVLFRPARYESIMGAAVSLETSKKVLEGLGVKTKKDGDNLIAEIPTFRPDMEREIDLIEEIARITGMNNITPSLPRIQSQVPDRDEFDFAKLAKQTLSSMGLQESVTYSFVPKTLLTILGYENDSVEIANPLNKERATLRTTLIAGLLENLKRTKSRYMNSFAQFEVARVYKNNSSGNLPIETLKAAAVINGPKKGWITQNNDNYDFYDIKGIVERFVLELTNNTIQFKQDSISYLHPARTLSVLIDGEQLGFVGEIHPNVLKDLKLEKGALAFELDLMKLFSKKRISHALPLSDFPPMERDVAFIADKNINGGSLFDALKKECGELAKEINIFDIYEGKNIDKDKKSIAFSVKYNALDKTLTDKEVDAIHTAAVEKVREKFNLTFK